MPSIHPTAYVSPEAELAEGVDIGPLCVVQGRVRLGKGTRLVSGVHIHGPCEIGEESVLYPGACVGYPPQDLKFGPGAVTAGVKIGARATLREGATVHAATSQTVPTVVGERIFMMVGSHIGHDCAVGSNVILVNTAALGGHVQLGDGATLGGGAMIHQHCRVGRMAFLGGGTEMSTDVPPFCMSMGRNQLVGVNVVGMRRAGFSRPAITAVREAYRLVFRGKAQGRSDMVAALEQLGAAAAGDDARGLLEELRAFVASGTKPVCRGREGLVSAPADEG